MPRKFFVSLLILSLLAIGAVPAGFARGGWAYVLGVGGLWCGVLAGLGIVLDILDRQRKDVVRLSCVQCEYDLRGSIGSRVCPECGSPIAKAQASALVEYYDQIGGGPMASQNSDDDRI